jgi:reactive chlorine resistance protein C
MTATSTEPLGGGAGASLQRVGAGLIRYGLVLLLVWIGASKFTAYEAMGIMPLVSSSPFMSWVYDLVSVRTFAAFLGVVEITLAVLIAARPFAPRLSAVGSLGAIVMFLITLSFVLTRPGVWQQGYGFPFLSGGGQFLVKDVVLLGAATWTAGEALTAARGWRAHRRRPASVGLSDR